ncbi:glycosyltransferase family 4 protein [Allohahella marinimesophila]|uniref:Glycosyltransferase involved in cell wall biosynthesis n=1 Tax=Allohahella marinimesophila TaxID=1054972 RepID=A0ABP7Q437_9GAMM
MKIAYIYLSQLETRDANINQMLSMCEALGKHSQVTLFTGWMSQTAFTSLCQFFSIKQNFTTQRLPVKLLTGSMLIEKVTRLLYCVQVLLALKASDFDVIYTRDITLLVFLKMLPAWARPKVPVIYEPHTLYHKTSEKVSYELELASLKLADYFIPISHGIARDLEAILGVDPQRITVLPDGVRVDVIASVKPQSLAGDRLQVLYSGSFIDWKGVETLIEAIPFVSTPNVVFLALGGVGKDFERIQQLVQSLGVGDRVELRSRMSQDELMPIAKSAHIGVLPNNRTAIGAHYTSPLKLFEYMANGLPIVASDLESMREILVENEHALFFEPSNPSHLAAQLDRLLQDEEMRRSIGQRNLEAVNAYSWDSRAERIIEIAGQLIR